MQENNKNGNVIVRGFRPSSRYAWDFRRCKHSEGWRQFDTDQDAEYFGVWYHPGKRLTFTYCEGDLTLVFCPTDEGFRAELDEMARVYGKAPRCATAFDAEGRQTDYFDPEARPNLDTLPERVPADLEAEKKAMGIWEMGEGGADEIGGALDYLTDERIGK